MIILEIHLIFDLIFDLIFFNFILNFHIGTTPGALTAAAAGRIAARALGSGRHPGRPLRRLEALVLQQDLLQPEHVLVEGRGA